MLILFQSGLHQMRASKDEGKPEPQTLIKFGNPYFKDTGGVVSNRKGCHGKCETIKTFLPGMSTRL